MPFTKWGNCWVLNACLVRIWVTFLSIDLCSKHRYWPDSDECWSESCRPVPSTRTTDLPFRLEMATNSCAYCACGKWEGKYPWENSGEKVDVVESLNGIIWGYILRLLLLYPMVMESVYAIPCQDSWSCSAHWGSASMLSFTAGFAHPSFNLIYFCTCWVLTIFI